MQQIKRKISSGGYRDLAAFRADMILLWDNARQYNQDGSWVHTQAEAMQAAFEDMYENEIGGSTAVGTPSEREPPVKLKLKLAGASRPKPVKKQSTPPSSDDSDDDDY
jgi:ATP-dependent helicase STH1/SNF2